MTRRGLATVLLALAASWSCAPVHQTGAEALDSGEAAAVDTSPSVGDTGSGTDTAGGCDVEDRDTASMTETVTLDVWGYDPARGCVGTLSVVVDSAYWWEYAELPPECDCADLAWTCALEDGTCLYVPSMCNSVAASDPMCTSDPVARETCGKLERTAPLCEGG